MKDINEFRSLLLKLDKEKTDLYNQLSTKAAEMDEERVKLQGEHRLIESLLGKLDEPSKKKS